MNDKEYSINDLLHTAKELEKWQAKDTDCMPLEKTVDDIRHERQDRDEYSRYRRGEM